MSPAKVLAAAIGAALLCAAPAALAQTFAVTGVRVFDGEKVIPKATVVVRDGRVVAMGPSVTPPAGASVVDGAGKTLLPGLIDAHTHTFGAGRADALRFGVTAELDMFTHPSALDGAKAAREALGEPVQADLFSSGILATAPKGHGTEYGFEIPTLTAPDEAQAWVKARVAEGSDYIKIVYAPGPRNRPSIDRAILEALVKAAHAERRLAVVHVQVLSDARTAIEVGADGLVHTFADAAADADFYRLAARKVFVIPTLSVISGFSGSGEGEKLAADPSVAALLSAEQKQAMTQKMRGGGFSYPVAEGSVAAFRAAKVDVLAGTDAGNPTTGHGATLHEEMALLVRAGLTPVEALKAATSLPAKRFSLGDRGRIAVGGRADLVLVLGDPTADIATTRAIATIWKNGKRVERAPNAARGPAAIPLSGVLGDFEAGLAGAGGVPWQPTSDKLAGGASEARVSQVPGANGSRGALKAEGEVKPPFPFAWAGAQLFLAGPGAPPRDISAVTSLVFRVRGTGSGAQGKAMLFDTSSPLPKEQVFAFSPDWQEVRVAIAGFKGLNPKAVIGVVIATDSTKGAYAFEIDDVRLE